MNPENEENEDRETPAQAALSRLIFHASLGAVREARLRASMKVRLAHADGRASGIRIG